MRDEYDFSNSRPNPYVGKIRKQVTIRLNADTIDYFKRQAGETGIPYQNLINLYLTDCADKERKIVVE
ncbi:MAG: BrnA antitoxin family protein [Coriobacteriia bacterium]|nr:BrnA antitoxin family protein [Coriobacteriia bacterium]